MDISRKKKVIIWTKGIDDFIKGENKFNGGITVQMYFWSKTFQQRNWEVFSFSNNQNANLDGIKFIKIPSIKKIGIITDFLFALILLIKIKPHAILQRGASRNLFFIAFWAKLLGIKLVFLGARDNDFEVGNELIRYKHDRMLYRWGIRITSNFILQNKLQEERLRRNYRKKKILCIPNIWLKPVKNEKIGIDSKQYALWVGTFNKRKRPEWYIDLSKKLREKKFVMVGGPGNLEFYNQCKSASKLVENMSFLGQQNFWFTNTLFSKAKVFVCTSESEGFPNTFLQAWANNKPIITTFDPSGIVKKEGLGIVVSNMEELANAVYTLESQNKYEKIQNNITQYFFENHNAQNAYNSVITLLK